MNFTTVNPEQRKSYLLVIMMIAKADNTMHGNEEKFITEVANRLGISSEELNELKAKPLDVGFSFPKTEPDKMSLLFDMFFTMRMDQDIAGEEEKVFTRVGMLMGINYMLLTDFLIAARQYVGERMPEGVLVEIIKKYHQ